MNVTITNVKQNLTSFGIDLSKGENDLLSSKIDSLITGFSSWSYSPLSDELDIVCDDLTDTSKLSPLGEVSVNDNY